VQLFGISTHLVSSFQIYRIEVCRTMMRGGNVVGFKGGFPMYAYSERVKYNVLTSTELI
jgi:hypothetical protein